MNVPPQGLLTRRWGPWALGARSLPRWLHPGAWWVWALGLAAAASRTTNPFLLLAIVATCAVVVHQRRPDAPWARSFRYFLILGAIIVAVRVVFQVVLGAAMGQTLLLDLPGVGLPTWLAGIRLGGPVYLESLLAGLYDGMRLATLIICVGAANALASPTRLLKSVPAALYEVGEAVVVAMSFTPRLIESIVGIRATKRLRGRPERGPRAIASSAVPVLHSALEDSVVLAAAMDSRGYGRRGDISVRARRTSATAIVIGLLLVLVGVYGLLAPGTSIAVALTLLGIGIFGSIAGLQIASARSTRTVYRPDPWWLPEWWTAATGIVAATTFVAMSTWQPELIAPTTAPPVLPALPMVCLVALGFAATPSVIAPQPPLRIDKSETELVNA